MHELLLRCQRGDDEAVETLVRRFRAGALDLATAILGDAHSADDVVQEAFVTALRRLGDLRQADAFPGWFRQIVRRECFRVLRRRKETSVEQIPEALAETLSPSESLFETERRRLVREVLASLPAAGRETAEMFYLEECDLATVSTRLHLPVGTVKRRLHDARKQMRILLGRALSEVPIERHTETKLPL